MEGVGVTALSRLRLVFRPAAILFLAERGDVVFLHNVPMSILTFALQN